MCKLFSLLVLKAFDETAGEFTSNWHWVTIL